jgi:hypothetical protein
MDFVTLLRRDHEKLSSIYLIKYSVGSINLTRRNVKSYLDSSRESWNSMLP